MPVKPVTLNPALNPVDRQPGETPRAYALFRTWLAMGPGQRSIRKAAQVAEVSEAVAYQWSSAGHWDARARDHDSAVTRAWFDNLADERMKAAHALVAEANALMADLAAHRSAIALVGELPAADYAKHLGAITTIFKTVFGAAPTVVAHTGPDGGPVDVTNLSAEQASAELAEIVRAAVAAGVKISDGGG